MIIITQLNIKNRQKYMSVQGILVLWHKIIMKEINKIMNDNNNIMVINKIIMGKTNINNLLQIKDNKINRDMLHFKDKELELDESKIKIKKENKFLN